MGTQLGELCGQFEEVMMQTLLTATHLRMGSPGTLDGSDGASERDDLFTHALAAAIERAGGIGLKAELVRSLSGAQ